MIFACWIAETTDTQS